MSPASGVCGLAAVHLAEWAGLRPFPAADAPACLGSAEREGWLGFGAGWMTYRVYRAVPHGATVWLFSVPGGPVCLVEVFSPQVVDPIGPMLRVLGEPEMRYAYPLAARLQRMLGEPGEQLHECVWGQCGLAVLIGRRAEAGERILRLRGFETMPAGDYHARFVDLPEVRFLPE